MSGKREVRAWKLTPIFDPEPGTFMNAGTTFCLATGEYLLGTHVGEALSPEIVRQLRKNDQARTICDANLLDAAIEFLNSGEGLHKIRVNGKMMDRKAVALALSSTHSGSPAT